jgi:hypothetical protein
VEEFAADQLAHELHLTVASAAAQMDYASTVTRGQSEHAADDYPQHRAANIAAAGAGAEAAGQTGSGQDGGK